MKKHRGLFAALGLGALISLMGSEAHAELFIKVTFGSNTVTINSGNGGNPNAVSGATNNLLTADTTKVNQAISTAGGNFAFSSLGVNSNWVGAVTGSTLNLSGGVYLTSGASAGPITVTAYEMGFTTPNGVGTLYSSSSGNFNDAAKTTDNFVGSSSLDTSYSTTPLTVASANSMTPNQGTGGGQNSIAANGNAAGYQLSDTATISLAAGALTGSGNPGSTSFSVNALFVSTAVPEPASLVMMLTGMPLPLVVMGLLRRRRGA